MKSRGFQLGLPLLSKELTELANRRRTYIIRTIYALLFLGFVGFIYIDLMSGLQNNPMAILGRGRDIFEAMIYLQFIAIYLFLPAISCSVITHEKERNSLGLLLITRLSPGTIILEKYLGRLITMLTFLTLGLPILAFAYALGGVSPAMFISGIWFLLMTMLQVAALGVLCSSFFRSTVGAFIATYVFGFFMLFGPIIVYELNLFYYRELFHVFSQVLQNIPALSNLLGNWGRSSELNLFLFGPYLFDLCSRTTGISAILGPLILSIPMLTVTLMFLIMAHYFLVRRAFLTPRNLLLNMFRKLDSQFSKINDNRVTRGIILVQDDVKLPENDPIAWRETSKKSLGTFRYLFRILVALEVPILFLCILIATGSPEPVVPGAVMLLWGVWILTTLLLAVSATSLIAGERSHETLDVLLTAPLSGREILRQKIAGVRRLCLVLLIPLLTIVLFETWWKMEYHLAGYSINFFRHTNYSTRWFAYFTGSMLTISIYLPMLIYLFCWIGMKIKSQTKAILTSLGGVILWCLSPFILAFPLFVLNPSMNEDSVIYGVLLGPASFIVVNEIAEFREFGSIWIPLILNSLIYGCLCFWFRHLCLGHIDERLGRLGDTPEQDYVPPASPRESKPVLSSPLEGQNVTRMFRTYLNYKIINQLLLLFMLLMLPSAVYAIDVEETIWGFNNQPVRGKFVPLSLRLSNNTPEVFDEAVQLNRQQFNGTKVGAPLYKKVYLPPYSSQWVQFYPYIVDGQDEDWSLNWGPGFVQYRSVKRTGGTVTTTGPLRIIIAGSDGLLQGGASFKKYPEDLFPPFVTATDSLDEVILGHVPRWDVARRVSFMDWLEQGGVLHLLPAPSGESLKFTSTLAPLNAPFDHFRVGAGLVIRHDTKLNQLKATTLDERIQAVRDSEAKSLGIYAAAPLANESQSSGENYDPYQYGDINSGFLYQLSELTRPTHNWAVIYIMTLFYIFLIFPGCYLFQHRKNMMRYRNSLLFLLCTVSVFSIIFWTIGKRGYGEKTTINSLLLAKPLPDNQLDLTCWMNCFVTEGDDYQFTEDGEGAIFSTAQVIERVRGGIFNGNDGRFVSDIPPFSSRRMIYRIKAPYTSPRFSVQDYEIDMENGNVILKQLTLKSETPLPPGLNHRQLILGKYVYDLIPSSGENPSELSLGKSRELLSAWNRHLDSDLLYASRLRTANSDEDIEQVYDGLRTHLILKDLGLLSSEKLQQYQGNSSRLQLFLYGEIPETLKVKTNVQGTQQGRILFAYNLALPEKKNLTNDK